MNQTPLNPDAHADVARMRGMVAEAIDNPGESVHEFVSLPDLYQLLDHLAAPPVVNSVNELDALPAGSVVRDRHGRVWTSFEPRVSMPGVEYYRWMCPDGGFIRRKGWFSSFPATVLYRPEVDE